MARFPDCDWNPALAKANPQGQASQAPADDRDALSLVHAEALVEDFRCAIKRWPKGHANVSEMLHKFWLGQSWLSSCPLNPARTLTGASWLVTALHPMQPTRLLKNKANLERRGSRATK